MSEIPEGTPCARCREHTATAIRALSAMEYVHGHYDYLCECCCIALNLMDAERMAALVPQWRADFAQACQGERVAPAQELISANAKLRDQVHHQWLMAHYYACGAAHYPEAGNAMNYAAPHAEGEWCYWPEPKEDEGE